jgi:hypothetical protein
MPAFRNNPDEDLLKMTRPQLIAEVRKLRAGIRAHRDSNLHDLCWHHPQLWGLLPDKTDPLPEVPAWPRFLEGCIHYRQSLDAQLPDAPRSMESFRDFQAHPANSLKHRKPRESSKRSR